MVRQHASMQWLVACSTLFALSGCMPKMTVDQLRQMRPARPPQLDRLDAFVGKWSFEGQAKMAMLDTPIEVTGSNEAQWDGDRWYVVSRGLFHMGELGDMQGIETWTYDAHAKTYRSTWVDNMGSVGSGKMHYDADEKEWEVLASSHGPHGKTWMKGELRFIDDDTLEWSMTEYSGLTKTMEMTGTSRRQK